MNILKDSKKAFKSLCDCIPDAKIAEEDVKSMMKTDRGLIFSLTNGENYLVTKIFVYKQIGLNWIAV